MTKTIYPLMSHYSSTKLGGGGWGALTRGEAPILNFGRQKGRLFERGRLFDGGGGGGGRNFEDLWYVELSTLTGPTSY